MWTPGDFRAKRPIPKSLGHWSKLHGYKPLTYGIPSCACFVFSLKIDKPQTTHVRSWLLHCQKCNLMGMGIQYPPLWDKPIHIPHRYPFENTVLQTTTYLYIYNIISYIYICTYVVIHKHKDLSIHLCRPNISGYRGCFHRASGHGMLGAVEPP